MDSPPKTSDTSRSAVLEKSAAIDMATTSSALALLDQYSDESESDDDDERTRESLLQSAVQDNDTAIAVAGNDGKMPITGKIHSLSSDGVSVQEEGGGAPAPILSSVKALVQRATELFGGRAGVMLKKV